MITKIEKITPEMAQAYLDESNTDNYRILQNNRAKQYARDMAAGLWQMNGETIVFSESGILKDGQHRLAAIVMSGVTCEMLVVRGVSDDVNVYDIGGARTYTQIAKAAGLEGHLCTNTMAAVAKIIVLGGDMVGHPNVSAERAAGFILKNERFMRHLAIVSRGQERQGNTPLSFRRGVVLGVMTCLYNGISDYDAAAFCRIVCTGFPEGVRDCTPPIVLRNYLLAECLNRKDTAQDKKIVSMTIDGLTDFSQGRARRRMYKLSERNLEMLKEACKQFDV